MKNNNCEIQANIPGKYQGKFELFIIVCRIAKYETESIFKGIR